MNQSIIIFDTETTDLDPKRDQIVELSVQYGLEPGARNRTWRFKPSVPISPDAQAVHGISMEDLEDCGGFAAYADEIRTVFEEADVLVGYNLDFDREMLQAEFARSGQSALDLAGKLIIDPLLLWRRYERHTLANAHRRFVGGDFENAHSATADIAATGRVLLGMMDTFGLENESWSTVASACNPHRMKQIGPSHHFRWEEGVPTIAFGKHSGTSVKDLVQTEGRGYLEWMLEGDFPGHVVDICRKALETDTDAFQAWVIEAFGPCPAEEAQTVNV